MDMSGLPVMCSEATEVSMLSNRRLRLQSALETRILRSLHDALAENRSAAMITKLLQQSDVDLIAPHLPGILIPLLRTCTTLDDADIESWDKVAKASHLLRYIVWGAEAESDVSRQMLGWRQRWRKIAGQLLTGELQLSQSASQMTLLHPRVVVCVWQPAAIMAGVDISETRQLLFVLNAIHAVLDDYGHTLRRVADFIELAFDSCPNVMVTPIRPTIAQWSKLKVNRHHELLTNGDSPTTTVRQTTVRFVREFAQLFALDDLINFLQFRRDTNDFPQATFGRSTVAEAKDLGIYNNSNNNTHPANDAPVIRYSSSQVPMTFFYEVLSSLDEPSLHFVFNNQGQTSSTGQTLPIGQVLPKPIASSQDDAKLIQLMDLLLGYRETNSSESTTMRRVMCPGVAPMHTPLLRMIVSSKSYQQPSDTGWVVPLAQWHYWSRHPTLFFAMCQRFGAPLRRPIRNGSRQIPVRRDLDYDLDVDDDDDHEASTDRKNKNTNVHASFVTDEWPVVALGMLGLQPVSALPNRKNPLVIKHAASVNSDSVYSEELAVGSLWYSMAASWTGHNGYLGLCPLKLPSKRTESGDERALVCTCVYCSVFRSGWQRAYKHVEAFLQLAAKTFPPELAHIVWNFLLYDPRPSILAIRFDISSSSN
jgi:hypothetical protein